MIYVYVYSNNSPHIVNIADMGDKVFSKKSKYLIRITWLFQISLIKNKLQKRQEQTHIFPHKRNIIAQSALSCF